MATDTELFVEDQEQVNAALLKGQKALLSIVENQGQFNSKILLRLDGIDKRLDKQEGTIGRVASDLHDLRAEFQWVKIQFKKLDDKVSVLESLTREILSIVRPT